MPDKTKKISFLRAVRGEFRNLRIPDRKTVAKTTLFVMGASVTGGLVLGMFNAFFSNLMAAVFF